MNKRVTISNTNRVHPKTKVLGSFLFSKLSRTPIFFSTEIKEGQVRCGEHSDYGTLTLLFQDLIGGLEVNMSLYLIIDIDLYIKKDEMRGAQLNGQVI